MNCPKCNETLKTHILNNFEIKFCQNCWDHIQYNMYCKNHSPEYVKVKYSNDSIHIKKQCLECGKVESKLYPKAKVKNWKNFPFSKIIETESEDFYKPLKQIYERYHKKGKDFKQSSRFSAFLNEHSEYLETDGWKKKRSLVLKRDNNICQSCLDNKAIEVHHKSYKYWKNKPLFDLISVCRTCHDEITNMNRDKMNFDFIQE